jgi:hypothetical protein
MVNSAIKDLQLIRLLVKMPEMPFEKSVAPQGVGRSVLVEGLKILKCGGKGVFRVKSDKNVL